MKENGGVGTGVLIIVGILFLGMALTAAGVAFNLITIPWLKFERKVEMNRDIVKKTYDADNALYNYHWFKERYEAIKAQKNKINIADKAVSDFEESAGSRDKWTFEDKTEDARLRAVAQGNKSHYEEIVAEYNARAKEADRSVFQDELPLFVDLN